MNPLNSIIVEGTLAEDPVRLEEPDRKTCSCLFCIQSHRYTKKGGISRKESYNFTVLTYGGTAESCLNHLKKDRGIRIVGRLEEKQPDDSSDLPRIYITAEHVEFKPQIKVS